MFICFIWRQVMTFLMADILIESYWGGWLLDTPHSLPPIWFSPNGLCYPAAINFTTPLSRHEEFIMDNASLLYRNATTTRRWFHWRIDVKLMMIEIISIYSLFLYRDISRKYLSTYALPTHCAPALNKMSFLCAILNFKWRSSPYTYHLVVVLIYFWYIPLARRLAYV